jgi:hypothetical protein
VRRGAGLLRDACLAGWTGDKGRYEAGLRRPALRCAARPPNPPQTSGTASARLIRPGIDHAKPQTPRPLRRRGAARDGLRGGRLAGDPRGQKIRRQPHHAGGRGAGARTCLGRARGVFAALPADGLRFAVYVQLAVPGRGAAPAPPKPPNPPQGTRFMDSVATWLRNWARAKVEEGPRWAGVKVRRRALSAGDSRPLAARGGLAPARLGQGAAGVGAGTGAWHHAVGVWGVEERHRCIKLLLKLERPLSAHHAFDVAFQTLESWDRPPRPRALTRPPSLPSASRSSLCRTPRSQARASTSERRRPRRLGHLNGERVVKRVGQSSRSATARQNPSGSEDGFGQAAQRHP